LGGESKFFFYDGLVGLGQSVGGLQGLGWVEENGPTDNSLVASVAGIMTESYRQMLTIV